MRSAEQLRQSSEPGPGVVSFLEDEPFARLMVNLVDWKASDAGDAPRVTAQRHTVSWLLTASASIHGPRLGSSQLSAFPDGLTFPSAKLLKPDELAELARELGHAWTQLEDEGGQPPSDFMSWCTLLKFLSDSRLASPIGADAFETYASPPLPPPSPPPVRRPAQVTPRTTRARRGSQPVAAPVEQAAAVAAADTTA